MRWSRELAAEGISAARPPLGIMVEVPAVAIMPKDYLAAEFFSIGSNDLTQYVTAAARDSHRVADLCDVTNPAVMKLIGDVAAFGVAEPHRSQPLRRRGGPSGAGAAAAAGRPAQPLGRAFHARRGEGGDRADAPP